MKLTVCRVFDDLNDKAAATIAGALKFKHAEQTQNKLIRDLVESREHIRNNVRQAIETAEAVAVDEEFRSFHRRRAEQSAEQKVITHIHLHSFV